MHTMHFPEIPSATLPFGSARGTGFAKRDENSIPRSHRRSDMFPIHPQGSSPVDHRSLLRRLLTAIAVLAPTLFTACNIASPQLPGFTTLLNIPFQKQEVLMSDLVEQEDLLFSDDEGGLYIYLEGDSLRVDLDQDLSIGIEAQESQHELGSFHIETADAGNYAYELDEIYPDVLLLPPGLVQVPPFEFELHPDPKDIVNVETASVESGFLMAVVDNQFQVPLSGPNLPNKLRCEIRDSSNGNLLDVIEFPEEIPPGAADSAMVDLSGQTLPDSVSLTILGGSPGAPAVENVDPYRVLNVNVEFVDLLVNEALAVVGEQSVVENMAVAIGDSLEILDATIASGHLDLSLGNQMPFPVQAELYFDEIFGPEGDPVSAHMHLNPGESEETVVDLQDARILAPGSEALERISYRVEMSSPGSGGEVVPVSSTDFLTSAISTSEIVMSECTGRFPRSAYELDPVSESLALPEELEGVQFAEATLVLDILNEERIPAELQIHVESQYANGDTLSLDHVAQIAAAEGRGGKLTRVVLDGDNSILPEMLSGAPDRIELGGRVLLGGDVIGTVASGLGAELHWSVEAPLRASFEPAEIHRNPFALGLDEDLRGTLSDHLHSARLLTEIDNGLPLDLSLSFLVGEDSLTVYSSPLREIGPFLIDAAPIDASGFVSESRVESRSLALDREDVLALTAEGHYVAISVEMPGTNGQEVAFRPSDFLSVKGILEAEVNSSAY